MPVQDIHNASDKIVSWLQSPAAAKINTRGLVVGYVQSGKTANFTAVIAKAADAGYRLYCSFWNKEVAEKSNAAKIRKGTDFTQSGYLVQPYD